MVCESILSPFLLLSSIPLYEFIKMLPIQLLMGIWIISSSELLWMQLPWTFGYKYCCKHVFIPLGSILGVEMLSLMITEYSTLEEMIFQRGCAILHSYQHCVRVPGRKSEQTQLILLVSLLWDITDLHCLLFNIWKQLFHVLCQVFSLLGVRV